ncbi:MAG: ABC transporter substrate-binding protein [Deltaproteobacteria bacterium]|nr:ABC transporter substrate-binding protein [Deltaproteobacteria bacterium]
MKKILPSLFTLMVALLSYSIASAAPKDTVFIAQGVDPGTLDPQNHYETPAFNVLLNIYETLLLRNNEMKLTPLLATSWKLINNTTWEFTLRKGVKFHNGEDFNAAAAKFSLERIADGKNKLKQTTLVGIIDRVEIIDNYTIRVITTKPYPYLDAQLAHLGAMMPPQYTRDKGPSHIALHPIGTGPYKLARWVKDDQLTLEANDRYWGGAPRIKKAILRPIPEATTRVAALQTQEADIIVNIPPHLARLMDWKGRSSVAKVPSSRVIFMAFDTTQGGPVADKKVRQAIAQAIDVDKILKNVLEGNAIRLGTPFTKYHFGYDPAIRPNPFNPEMAKKLLAEAGAQGFELTLNSPNGRYLNDKEVSEAAVGDLRKVGINARVKIHEWGTYMNMTYAHKAGPSYLLGWGGATFDADATLFPMMRTGQVLSHYSNPKLDAMIEEGRSIMDKAKRQKIYSEAAKLVKEEVPWAFAYQQIDIYGVSARLNWKPRADEKLFVVDMSFKK